MHFSNFVGFWKRQDPVVRRVGWQVVGGLVVAILWQVIVLAVFYHRHPPINLQRAGYLSSALFRDVAFVGAIVALARAPFSPRQGSRSEDLGFIFRIPLTPFCLGAAFGTMVVVHYSFPLFVGLPSVF